MIADIGCATIRLWQAVRYDSSSYISNMDYRVCFSVLLFISAAVTAPSSDTEPVLRAEDFSNGPSTLSEEEQLALGLDFLRKNNVDGKISLLANPGEGTHGILEGLLKGAETAMEQLEHLVQEVKSHEEKSHRAIDNIRSSAPEVADHCVQNVFGMSNRAHPVYCSVKYFSRVAIGLYEMKETLQPLRQTVTKLSGDLTACNKITTVTEAFICRAQALRDAWEDSDVLRARLNRHLILIRQLAVDISECLKDNQPIQTQLLAQVHQCAKSKAKPGSF